MPDISKLYHYAGSPIRRLDDDLMDLMIARNAGSQYARRHLGEAPRLIEEVMREVRDALLREKESNQRTRAGYRSIGWRGF